MYCSGNNIAVRLFLWRRGDRGWETCVNIAQKLAFWNNIHYPHRLLFFKVIHQELSNT